MNVTVMTAELFNNAVSRAPELFQQISMIILDECHNTRKNHPYRTLMVKHFLPLKQKSEIDPPKILGLSASPASKETTGETMINIMQLCHDLGCRVRQVTKQNEELEKHVHKPDIEVIVTDLDEKAKEVKKFVLSVMGPTKETLLSELYNKNDARTVSLKNMEYGSEEFENEVNSYQSSLHITELMCRFNQSLILLDNRSCHACWEHMVAFHNRVLQGDDEILKKVVTSAYDPRRFDLNQLPKNCNKQLALLQQLEKDLRKNALVFVKTKEDAIELKELITDRLRIQCECLLGHAGEFGMTSHEQQTVVDKFKKREITVLIATSVAEEGLDIPDCNLVVRMYGINSALELIQSRGRARSKESRFLALYHKGSHDLVKLERSKIYEYKMKHAIDILSSPEVEKRLDDTIYSQKSIYNDLDINLSVIFDIVWITSLKIKHDLKHHIQLLEDLNEKQTEEEPIQLLTATVFKLMGVNPVFISKAKGASHSPMFTGSWSIELKGNPRVRQFVWPTHDNDFEWFFKKSEARACMAKRFLAELKARDLIVHLKNHSQVPEKQPQPQQQQQDQQQQPNKNESRKKLKDTFVSANKFVTERNSLSILNYASQSLLSKIIDEYESTQFGYFVCTIKLHSIDLSGVSGGCNTKAMAKKEAAMDLVKQLPDNFLVPETCLL
ncbi:hypothetical protein AKO1_007044 [Acrasis kona]|uniref:RNA helicase n=1 Tax=Acrasis kona TaxID=1008807 RepID=A0AAW2YUM3_9EUKA